MSLRRHPVSSLHTKAACFGRIAFVLFLSGLNGNLSAQVLNDSLSTPTLHADTLSDVNVRGHRPNSYLLEGRRGTTLVDLRLMENMPHILGNADPMHYAQLLPGIQTNSEYDAGLHMQGCDNAHNAVMINGVPLYNISHLLGFFSIFNTPHFATMQFTKSPVSAAADNRLGGLVDMATPDTLHLALNGNLSVGPISSQGTLRLPLGSRSALTLSARMAYLNLLYGQWLKLDEEELNYTFSDYNVNWLYRLNNRHSLQVDFYYGGDKASYADDSYAMDTRLKWGNTMLSIQGNSLLGSTKLHQTLYYTHYFNRFNLTQSNLHIGMPSSITDIAYKADLQSGAWDGGLLCASHTLQPQDPLVEGMYDIEYTQQPRQQTLEAVLYGNYTMHAGPLALTAGLRTTYYQYADYRRLSTDPIVSLSWEASPASTLSLRSSVKHQYLHRVGFSDMGLPTEFWFSADGSAPAQYSWNLSLDYDGWWLNRMLHVTLEVYYKQLYHQQEYSGNVFDILYSTYDLHAMLLHGRGRNYGLNLMVEKRKGWLTGWISYSWGRAMRKFDNSLYTDWYPANHERIHELNAVATRRLSERWSVGGTFVFASGTPFTAPRKFFLVNEQLVSVFGEHNAQRLRPYLRLDLSANYDFKPRKGRRSGLNFSLYNVTMSSNDLFYRLKIYQNRFAGKPLRFVMPILPSINYYYQF